MNEISEMRKELIAPCGMNCRLCMAYQRNKNKCNGCLNDIGYKSKSCSNCIIKNCAVIQKSETGFCYECVKYPCRRLKDLDKRYKTKYNMSMIENLEYIKQFGIDKFLQSEEVRWTCEECGDIVSVHHSVCNNCKTQIE